MSDPPPETEDTICPQCGCDTTVELPGEGEGICECDCHWRPRPARR